jgi:4'-phosphopantetheinyl transferase EntD
MRLRTLERHLGRRLGAPVIFVRSDTGVDRTRLNRAECDRLSGFRNTQRKRDWLLGRRALKEILLALGRTDDTTTVVFPDKQVSLTHGGNIAYAAGTTATDLGIGIDYEPMRELDTRVARWFLNDSELQWLTKQPVSVRATELLRLWTVKEAAFKSHPDNARMTLGEFAIADPATAISSVFANGRHITVTCCARDSGYLSVAICREST